MGEAKNLSFSTGFNQPKILFNDHEDVTIPVSVGTTPDLLFAFDTELLATPRARLFFEYNGRLSPLFGTQQDFVYTHGLSIRFTASFTSDFALEVYSFSIEAAPVDAKIYYRIYVDAHTF